MKELHELSFFLKPFEEKYVTENYLKWMKDPFIQQYILSATNDIKLEDIKNYCTKLLSNKNELFWAILLNDDNVHIGNVRLTLSGNIAKLGMMIGNKDFHNQGIGTLTVKLLVDYCFNELTISKMMLDVITENKPAIRIYEKNGFEITNRIDKFGYKNDVSYDVFIMELHKKDYLKNI